ncbi:hypothetical protein KQI41_02740 [Tissierella pigra]|uniref:RAMP superfamily CRISPR-associated protein n=1 Tax=Tissierella pigra TaxID=2607614 RepID=UPI001C10C288|nr:RAMP superfamily CRISPR-associated protein [Tissierella pigra]MBU5425319.1 hypothetical protein [Tissierella pigra]
MMKRIVYLALARISIDLDDGIKVNYDKIQTDEKGGRYMRKVEIKLKLITQLISFGADQKKKEFRVTELKALLRNTFRELYYFKDLEDIRNKEAYLFGNTENKAPVSIVSDGNNVNNLKEKEKEFNEGTEFIIYFIERKKKDNNMDFLKFYINLLIQSSIIGGIGQYVYLGKGAFEILEIKNLSNEKTEDFNILIPHNTGSLVRKLCDIGELYLDNNNNKSITIRKSKKKIM